MITCHTRFILFSILSFLFLENLFLLWFYGNYFLLLQELLALEEKMGTVSTALSEEELSKCIRKSVYESDEKMRHSLGAEDNKCSICQVIIIIY